MNHSPTISWGGGDDEGPSELQLKQLVGVAHYSFCL